MLIKLKNGNTHYISKLDDFEEVVEPAIYKAIEEFIGSEIASDNKDSEIEDLEEELSSTEDSRDYYCSLVENTNEEIKELINYVKKEDNTLNKEGVLDKIEDIYYRVLGSIS